MTANVRNAQVPPVVGGGPDPLRPSTVRSRPHFNRPWCRTSEYKPPGSEKVGLASGNQPSKVVYELDYGLNDQQFKALSNRFPGVAFVQTGIDCHDHPIAHTSYRIVWENIMRKLRPGSLCADVSGNPQHNELFNKRQEKRANKITIDTFCKVLSTKDSVRAKTRWGPQKVGDVTRWEEMTLYDMYRNEENQARFAKYDVFLFNHVLYYYKMAEITKLLALNPSSVAIATVHKLPGREGTLNCGEQSYVKDLQSGVVTQTNVDTGEEYRHPDPAPWFSNFAYADEGGAIAWTINKGCDDTYVITITSTDCALVPQDCWLDRRIVRKHGLESCEVTPPVVADPPPAYKLEQVTIKANDLVPGYMTGHDKTILITHPELYEVLKAFMINKPRSARTLADLTAKAHREVGNNVLASSKQKIVVSSESLTEHVFAAWVSGVALEASLFAHVHRHVSGVSSVNANLSGRGLSLGPSNALKQAVRAALGVNAIVRSREPVEAVLRHVDDLL